MSAYFDSFHTMRELQNNNIILKRPREVTLGCLERKKPQSDVDEASQVFYEQISLWISNSIVFLSLICQIPSTITLCGHYVYTVKVQAA